MTFKKLTFVIAAVALLALGACTAVSTFGTAGGTTAAASSVSVPTATDVPRSGPDGASQDGNTFVHSPEPGFDPDSISEAP